MIEGAKKLPSGTIYVADKKHEHYLQVLTSCCGTYSTVHVDNIDESPYAILCCKQCWNEVEPGEGDGSLYLKEGELV